jgi:hypothetical protein
VGGDIPVDSETLLVTDFMNLKIKSVQSFRCAHRDRVCVRVFIEVSDHTYINIYIYTVFLIKSQYHICIFGKKGSACCMSVVHVQTNGRRYLPSLVG